MIDAHFHAKFAIKMLCQMLRGIHTSVLSARAAEGEHDISKTTLQVAAHMRISEAIHTLKKCDNLSVVFQETNHGLIQSRKILIRLIAAGVMCAAAIKHITAPIAARILGNAFVKREAEYSHYKFAPVVILRPGCGISVRRDNISLR